MDFLLGGGSLAITNGRGVNRIFSLYVAPGADFRIFGRTKEFQPLPGAPRFFSHSMRNKAFLIGTDSFASLRYSTTESVRWQSALPFKVSQAVLGSKYSLIAFLDT